MPTIICPKCQGKLRFPEDSPARRVKCPTCGNVFLSSEGVASSGTTGSKEAPKARDSKDFELPIDDDRGRRSRQRDEDDDDDDRDRGRRRSNRDDDEYDRDRDRGRRRDSRYEDDDDDRGRRRRDSDDDDYDRDDRRRNRRDEDDYDRPRRKKNDARAFEGQMNRASLGCLLNFIGGWLQVGALGIMAFVIFLSWCGVHEGLRIFTVIAGLLGLAYLLASATGIGFLISCLLYTSDAADE